MTEEAKQLIDAVEELAKDINLAEIASQIETETLGTWCNSWMITMMITLNQLRSELSK